MQLAAPHLHWTCVPPFCSGRTPALRSGPHLQLGPHPTHTLYAPPSAGLGSRCLPSGDRFALTFPSDIIMERK